MESWNSKSLKCFLFSFADSLSSVLNTITTLELRDKVWVFVLISLFDFYRCIYLLLLSCMSSPVSITLFELYHIYIYLYFHDILLLSFMSHSVWITLLELYHVYTLIIIIIIHGTADRNPWRRRRIICICTQTCVALHGCKLYFLGVWDLKFSVWRAVLGDFCIIFPASELKK